MVVFKARPIAAALATATTGAIALLLIDPVVAEDAGRWLPRPTPLTPAAAHRPAADPLGDAAERQHLADQVVEQLRLAHQSAGRGADQTAGRAAVESLRAVAMLRDASTGGTTHAAALQVAMTAIREAEDFADRFGRVDAAAVRRLVAVHQTPAAANLDTTSLTPADAATAYLTVALGRLVYAAGGGPLAAEAVSILGDLAARQHRLADQGDGQSAAAARLAADVSLMYRRAAARIDPDGAAVLGRLGRSLLDRSLTEAAVPVLQRSVALQPLRENVYALAQATERTGDHVTSQNLQEALATRPLPTRRPLTVMSPQQFAATGPLRSPAGPIADLHSDPAVHLDRSPGLIRPAGSIRSAVVDPSAGGGTFFGRR